MARKDVLKGLLDPAPATLDPPAPPRAQRGAIGAVSRSFADLKARSVMEIDPHLIHAGGMQDRLENDTGEDADLRRSIAEYGQQVPVLVRPHPEQDGHFQIVYGRRRVLALRDLGQPVKALVRDLDDQQLILAQGQENTARRDLSFIEKVNFARQMETAGYARKIICDALSVDKTQISRMLAIAEKIPTGLIEHIGAAPSIGRDRWSALAAQLEQADADAGEVTAMINMAVSSDTSDGRFQAACDYLDGILRHRRPAATPPQTQTLFDDAGLPLGEVRHDRNHCTLKLRLARTDGFEDWLVQNLTTLLRDYRANRPGPQDD